MSPLANLRDTFYVGTSEIFGSRLMRRLAESFRLILIDPDANLVPAMRAGAYGLRKKRVLVLFPEGERSIDGPPKLFKKGAAILAIHTAMPRRARRIGGLPRSLAARREVSRLDQSAGALPRSGVSAAPRPQSRSSSTPR